MANNYPGIGIIGSGNGTNAQAIINKMNSGVLLASVKVIISNNPCAGILKKAEKAQIPAVLINHRDYLEREMHEQAITAVLRNYGCEYVVLAGYMRLLGEKFIEEWKGRIVNIHPALLPSFPGTEGIGDAWNYGALITGPTVHFVEREMDSGPLIIQAVTRVRDTKEQLEAEVHKLEHRIYSQAIQWLVSDRLKIIGRRVQLMPDSKAKISSNQNGLFFPPLEEGF